MNSGEPPAKRQKNDLKMGTNSTKVRPSPFPTSLTSSKLSKHPHTTKNMKKSQCDEHSHSMSSHGKPRACESTLHTLHPTHDVCTDCHRNAWGYLTRLQQSAELQGAPATLCRGCSMGVIRSHGIEYDSCNYAYIKGPQQA